MKNRIISAIIMIAVFLPILILGGKAFAVLMSFLACFALYELLHVRESKKSFPLLMKIFAYIMVLFFTLSNFSSTTFVNVLDYRTMSLIIFIFLSPMVFINDNKKYNLNDALFLISSTLFIGLSFNLFIITRNYDINYIIYLLLITAITDTFALFTGSLIGRHKLAKNISPKKTVEGLIGGVSMGTFAAVSFYTTVINSTMPLVFVIFITLFLALVGQLGDLVFSSIKRYYNKKDFSDLIPGHGGILDRFDSIIFVVLGFILFMKIL